VMVMLVTALAFQHCLVLRFDVESNISIRTQQVVLQLIIYIVHQMSGWLLNR